MCSSGKVKARRVEDGQFAAFMIANCDMNESLEKMCSCGIRSRVSEMGVTEKGQAENWAGGTRAS